MTAGVAPGPDPPQSTSGRSVMSQMATCGSSVTISASSVPLTAGGAAIGGRKKKPAVPPAWAASEIANAGPIRGAVGLSLAEQPATTAARTLPAVSLSLVNVLYIDPPCLDTTRGVARAARRNPPGPGLGPRGAQCFNRQLPGQGP